MTEGDTIDTVFSEMVGLIYAGHRDLAWRLWERAWPTEFAEIRQEYADTLWHELAECVYAKALETAYAARNTASRRQHEGTAEAQRPAPADLP